MKLAQKKLTKKKSRFSFTSFPNGWFCVGCSNELKPGEVKPLHYFGKDLVLFRTESGTPYVFDAYCPHVGAHLGYGGKVKGEGIQCPFHGWCFDSNGKCTDVPYSNKLPPTAQIGKWSVSELNGMIMLYYHSQKKPPTWEIPDLSKYIDNEGVPFRRIKQWKLCTHPQEVCEHSYDIGHINVHAQASHAKSEDVEFNGPIAVHRFSTQYRPPIPAAWIIGEQVNLLSEVRSYGLGFSFIIHSLNGKIKGRWLNIVLATPIDEEHSEIHLLFGMPKVFNKLLTRALEALLRKDLERGFELSLSLLRDKIHRSHVPFCDGDGSIAQFRQWSHQFYSEDPYK
ncbi:Rieske 2Fe-2S domain-containing protein [Brasilonema sp. UFV-L1]|uniref:Rieske 2Fe-2S domain-containing protein n=1 Tax=Brasilonema sp. UFV-L1 TaxID=2234130 RepID=UPI00145E7BD3|nr:Rieske 2Fe-2S domain-containing protein [Brasilonema sp. UFV-L1]NMG08656.1 Rieske (2Fe-2S) protein [Brasilonema sp. UFV-L1]